MTKKAYLAGLSALIWGVTLCLAPAALAATTLTGNWFGTAPKITLNGCSNDSVSLTINSQCGNLFSGTAIIGTNSVPVVGRFYPADNTVQGQGEYMDQQTYNYYYITFGGNYVAGNPPSILISVFSASSADINSLNTEYDAFSLLKQ